jgi:NADH-quinone oxidoreductase subunit G
MPKLIIDGAEIEVESGLTVFQACKQAGKEIPHFCFHERLNIAGNCRMCLVEMEKSPKPIASCAMAASEGMVIHTNTPMVQKAREGVMEFLLINHPLDCPICDKGGECDLQDQAFKYGSGKNRFYENKRSVKDKYMGPLIKTHMTRCIHCTRCIRFATEVAGIEEIGAIHRGEHMEVTSYLEKTVTSELSGNMIDICPVGALTSKPYAFKARSWELTKTESIDVLDAVGSNIRIDSRGLEVMRILPKINEDINEEWISDKARFAYDGLKYQRLDRPYIKKNGRLVESSWSEALSLVALKLKSLKNSEIAAISGMLSCMESMFLLKELFKQLGSNNISSNQFDYKIDTSARSNYLFNTTIAGIEQSDLCLLIGANPRHAAPILNARIGKVARAGSLKIARIGGSFDQTYKIQDLGSSPEIIKVIATGDHEFCKILTQAARPMIIVGDAVYSRPDGFAILSSIHKIVEKYKIVQDDWKGFNILHNHASMVGSLDISFIGGNVKDILAKAETGDIKFVYLLGADEIDTSKLKKSFVVYQGHHGDVGATAADVVLPGAAYTEKNGSYTNLEGKVQVTRAAVPPPGKAKEDWVIIRDLAKYLDIDLEVGDISVIIQNALSLANKRSAGLSEDGAPIYDFLKFTSKDKILKKDITDIPINYYMTDVISRSSVTMAKCTAAILKSEKVA